MSAAQQQLRRWATALTDGLVQGFGGPALGLAMQARMPTHAPIHAPIQAPAQPQAPTLKGATA
jgi:hypothetical protein